MSPLERAQKFLGGRANFQKIWAKAYLLAIMDANLSDFAFRVLELFAIPTLSGNPVTLSFEQIAEAMSRSERQAKRVVRELELRKYVVVSRHNNCRNAYTLNLAVTEVEIRPAEPIKASPALASQPKAVHHCAKCRRAVLGLDKAGWCRTCRNEVKLGDKIERTSRRVAREEIAVDKKASA